MDPVTTKETASDAKCGDCRYYYYRERWENGSTSLEISQCRYKPPTVEGWPQVDQNEWCGKFKRRETVHHIVTKEEFDTAKQRLQEYLDEEAKLL